MTHPNTYKSAFADSGESPVRRPPYIRYNKSDIISAGSTLRLESDHIFVNSFPNVAVEKRRLCYPCYFLPGLHLRRCSMASAHKKGLFAGSLLLRMYLFTLKFLYFVIKVNYCRCNYYNS
jgi:hypothetical protein